MPGSTVPDFNIRINGMNMPPDARSDIRAVTVHEDLDVLSMFTIELFNWRTDVQNQQSTWADAALFGIGNEVEIWLGYVDNVHKVMVAEITSLEATYSTSDDEEDVLIVRGYDHRHRLTRGRKTRTFSQIKDSAIVSQIATSTGLRAQAKDTKVALPYVVQSNQTDWEFLQSRAARIGYEVFVREKVLYFQPPQNTGQAMLRLALDTDISEFTPRLSSLAQVGEVTVRGWDVKQKQVIVGKAGTGQEASLMGGKSSGPRTANRAFGKTSIASVNHPLQSKAEADQMALGRFNEMALTYVQGDAVCGGQPKLRAGTMVSIEGMGKTFSGNYYVTSVVHTLTSDVGYETRFSVQRSAT